MFSKTKSVRVKQQSLRRSPSILVLLGLEMRKQYVSAATRSRFLCTYFQERRWHPTNALGISCQWHDLHSLVKSTKHKFCFFSLFHSFYAASTQHFYINHSKLLCFVGHNIEELWQKLSLFWNFINMFFYSSEILHYATPIDFRTCLLDPEHSLIISNPMSAFR